MAPANAVEEMVCVDTVAKSGDFLEDLDNTTAALDDDACCYILFKSDKENSQGKEWFLFSYVPDVVKVFSPTLTEGERKDGVRLLTGYPQKQSGILFLHR